MKRFFIVVLSLIAAISLLVLVFAAKFRIERHEWVITTAEITFVGLPDGTVFGTFTDYNGKVHSECGMYIDGRFQTFLNPMPIKPESYLGSTVRIMYDPSTIDSEGAYTTTNANGETITEYRFIEIESYDNWLRRFIISGIVFIASCTPIVAVCVKTIRKKKSKSSNKQI
ncbi:MAG: hypothetical protein NC203_06465 [Firmicutes bacterium]|nr:hypothetical protein [[Eubacterium] siraeum]MCM1487989.1 hypothetical protein [Bacillota bacterium]